MQENTKEQDLNELYRGFKWLTKDLDDKKIRTYFLAFRFGWHAEYAQISVNRIEDKTI